MSKDQFGNLVNQLSAQAEGERAAEQAALRRQLLFRRIRQGCFWMMFVGLIASGFVYREEVEKVVHQLAFDKPKVAGSSERAEKVGAVMKAAQKHAGQVDAASK